MKPIIPPPLKDKDIIAVMATSSWVAEEDLRAAKDFIENRTPYRVYIHPQATARHYQSAGTAEEKVKALHELIQDQNIRAIMGARGGNRAATMLPGLDFGLIAANPKILMGYSDWSVLLNGIHAKTGLVTYHGPLFRELPKRHADDVASVLDCFSGKLRVSIEGTVLRAGKKITGPLFGGNLSVFQGLIGTPYLPDLTGAILFLEDIGDHTSRYDRMFGHLRNAGVFDQIAGLVIGSFTDTKDDEERPFGFTFDDIVREHTNGMDFPIVMNAAFGHGERLITLPVGQKATLNGTSLTLA